MTRISLDYLGDGQGIAAPDRVLGVIALSGSSPADLSIGLPAVGPDSGGLREVWRADENVTRRGATGNLRYARAGALLFGVLEQTLPNGGTAEAAKAAYDAMLDLIAAEGCPHLLRVSNYIADITRDENGEERYRAFNAGRQAAFESRNRRSTQAPAACGLGCGGDALRLFFLASETPGHNIENPRQISAFDYPKQYGEMPPLFARATVAAGMLLISGTSSIVGHETVHIGDVAAQADETLRNLDALLAEARRLNVQVDRQALRLKVYLRHARDQPAVASRLYDAGFSAPVAWLQSDVCRPALDVEMEAHAPS
jgi:chorismate lyase/3-hydroxybenzoate synthase